jgi:hypothetical protein
MLEDRLPQLLLGDALFPFLILPEFVVAYKTMGSFGSCIAAATATQAPGGTSHLIDRYPNRPPFGPFVKERGRAINVVGALNVPRPFGQRRSSSGT